MKLKMSGDNTWNAVIGALVAVLSAFGVITSEESVTAVSCLTGIATGVIGLVALVKSIIARHKKEDKKEDQGDDVKAS